MKSSWNNQRRLGSHQNWLVLGAITSVVIAIIFAGWALKLQQQVDSRDREISELRSNANASLYVMQPTEIAPSGIAGNVWIGISGSGVIQVSNMPKLGDNEVFQVWFQSSESAEPVSGGTFRTDSANQGFALIPADAGAFSTVSISIEDAGGATAPTGSYLLTATVNGGKG